MEAAAPGQLAVTSLAPLPPQLVACLPPELRGADTRIARIGAGLSGAGVYRVDAGGAAYALKVSDAEVAPWRARMQLQAAASAAGVAPRVVHVDEARRAVVSELVADRGLMPRLIDPATREATIADVGRLVARVHALAIPPGLPAMDARGLLAQLARELDGAAPDAALAVMARVASERVPESDCAEVASHNDVNPTNLVFDGARVLLLDWDVSGMNDPYADLATFAVFLRLDDAACRALIAAHDDDAAPAAELPARFRYDRRLVAAACGGIFLRLARAAGYTSDGAGATLAEVYARMRAGDIHPARPDGQWQIGMALVGEVSRIG